MADPNGFLIENARDGRGNRVEAAVVDGRVHLKGRPAEGMPRLDCAGGRLLRGLTDHHVHLMASAAARSSLDLSGVSAGSGEFAVRLREATAVGPVRAVNAEDAERLDAAAMDAIAGHVPVRIQARTGGLWVLNRAAIAELRLDPADLPPAFERDAGGAPTGRVWRGDEFLRRSGACTPDLAALGADLARWGVTSVTDASVTTDERQAEAIASAGMSQRLTLMSGGPLREDPRWLVGPRKIILDERGLPGIEDLAGRIALARGEERNTAVHCVTHAELAVALAAFSSCGALPGDRIEHGAMIAPEAIPALAELGLTVVSNPGFITGRGHRYLREIPAAERDDLYRLDSLRRAGVSLAAGSDGPYGPLDPWTIMRAACDRRTGAGIEIGAAEALRPEDALRMHAGPAGRGTPEPADGDPADLVVLLPGTRPGLDADPVALTMIGGRLVYRRGASVEEKPPSGEPK